MKWVKVVTQITPGRLEQIWPVYVLLTLGCDFERLYYTDILALKLCFLEKKGIIGHSIIRWKIIAFQKWAKFVKKFAIFYNISSTTTITLRRRMKTSVMVIVTMLHPQSSIWGIVNECIIISNVDLWKAISISRMHKEQPYAFLNVYEKLAWGRQKAWQENIIVAVVYPN